MKQGSLGIISNLEEHYLTRMKDCNEYWLYAQYHFLSGIKCCEQSKRVDPLILKFIDDIFTSAMYMNYIKVNI